MCEFSMCGCVCVCVCEQERGRGCVKVEITPQPKDSMVLENTCWLSVTVIIRFVVIRCVSRPELYVGGKPPKLEH